MAKGEPLSSYHFYFMSNDSSQHRSCARKKLVVLHITGKMHCPCVFACTVGATLDNQENQLFFCSAKDSSATMCDCAAMPLDRLRRPLGARALALSRGAPGVHWGVRRVCLVDRGGCLAAEWRHEAPQARASALCRFVACQCQASLR